LVWFGYVLIFKMKIFWENEENTKKK
jgi:hypothetical protein